MRGTGDPVTAVRQAHEYLGQGAPVSWRSRAIVLAIVILSYGALAYGLAHMRPPEGAIVDGRDMFTPIVSQLGEVRGGVTKSKPYRPEAQGAPGGLGQATPPPDRWEFPAIDLWPSAPSWVAALSEFTPVTDARPVQTETQNPTPAGPPAPKAAPRSAMLRMVRWLRPVYVSTQCATLSAEGRLVLDLRIEPGGRPADIEIAQSSGSAYLDEVARKAAGAWRFAPPLWQSRPVEVWGRMALRFNC